MSGILNRFSVDAIKMDEQVIACMVIIWFFVLLCTLSSINKQPFTSKQRLFWMIVVTALPLVGVLLYLPFSFRIEMYPSLALLRKSK
ncbi:MAG TPA: PLDc N-terminal domain-containing protein [Verrucomicrobiota bacterium]|nr:PLDc N-terminal domain-containing protein [Verrucomicrobiota bacterium]